ncbi:MAG TPA: GNAT family N-acetyltransferase [Anaeromyxobacteraceae bacterium]|nr:GNAT family N-acetyltransferase [Anaeromyxobacteraceae bacterium]
MNLEYRDLTPRLWPELSRLFGPRGACGGCWCMWWRIEKGERWPEVKGAPARRRLRALVRAGRAHGILAFAGGEPVGWCSYERRVDLPRLDRAPSLACDDAGEVWSLPCFFVKAGWRGKGVASGLLRAALRALRRRGARLAEGYPVKPPRPKERIPAAFAYTGTPELFRAAGFLRAARRPRGRQRVRLRLTDR